MRVDFDSFYHQYNKGDIVIVTTDGLLKAISKKDLRSILNGQGTLQQKVAEVYSVLQEQPAPDNLGAIFITEEEST